MEIPKYHSFAEKEKYFRIEKIDDIDRFTEIFNEHKQSKGIYRGVNSSSFKIYSSLQREFITEGKNKNYLPVVRNNQYVSEYFKLANIPLTDLSYYSILQHFGKPTPIIDFTKNFSKAIFFAFEDVSCESKNEMDNYISVFFISTDDFDLINCNQKGISELYEHTDNIFKGYEDYTPEIVLNSVEHTFNAANEDIYLLEYNDELKNVINVNNNYRIIMQEGVFINNQYQDTTPKPLEESLKLFLEKEAKSSSYSMWDDMPQYLPHVQKAVQHNEAYVEKIKNFQRRLTKNIITSYEINKNLINDIKNGFELPNRDLIYFDLEKMMETI